MEWLVENGGKNEVNEGRGDGVVSGETGEGGKEGRKLGNRKQRVLSRVNGGRREFRWEREG